MCPIGIISQEGCPIRDGHDILGDVGKREKIDGDDDNKKSVFKFFFSKEVWETGDGKGNNRESVANDIPMRDKENGDKKDGHEPKRSVIFFLKFLR